SFRCGLGDQITERAASLSVGGGPVQSVLLSGIAAKRRRVNAGRFAVVRVLRVDVLSGDVGLTDPDHRKLVLANSARDDFLFAGRRIESPAVSVLHQRHGKWPRLMANHERLAVRSLI